MADVDQDEVSGERWPVVTAIGAVVTVAVVAAVVSYMHMREVAEAAGEEWRAILLPLSVDGMIVAATLNAWQAKRRQRSLPAMTLVALVAGLVVSIAANVAVPFLDVLRGQWLSAVVAAWPPIALAISFEELVRMLRQSGTRAAGVPERAAGVPDVVPGSGDDREAARELVRQDPDGWTGARLAERFGRSERWGRAQIAAVRAEQVQARRSSISAVQ